MLSKRTIGRPAARQRLSARAAILAAAEQAFAQNGLAGARTDAIAATAGVNNALLFYYFKSKEHLYEAVLENLSPNSTPRPSLFSTVPARRAMSSSATSACTLISSASAAVMPRFFSSA